MKLSTCLCRILGASSGLWLGAFSLGCSTGVIETNPQANNASFSQVYAQSMARSADDGSALPGAQPSPGSAALPAVEGTLEQKLTTMATCHPGELDLARLALKATGAKDLLISLEVVEVVRDSNAGWDLANTVLGAARVSLDEMSFHGLGQTVVPVKSARSMIKSLKLSIPGVLAQKSPFNASLFVCLDTNGNGSCADEAISSLNEVIQRANDLLTRGNNIFTLGFAPMINAALLRYEPGVLAYQPVQVTVWDRQIKVENALMNKAAMTPDQAALFDSAKSVGRELQSFSISNAQDVIIAEQTPDTTCQPQVRTNGCFVKGTKIALAGGKIVPVEQICKGMAVLTASGKSGEVKRAVAGPEKQPVITIRTLDQKSVTVTRGHPVMTRRGLKLASELTAADEILTHSKSFVGLTALTFSAPEGNVYNFELTGDQEADHLVPIEGLVLGDLYLQEKLSAKPMTSAR